MAKGLSFRFRVINASVAAHEVEIEHEGHPATVRQHRLYVDAEPLDGTEKTLELVLPADRADDIHAGDVLAISIKVETQEQEA